MQAASPLSSYSNVVHLLVCMQTSPIFIAMFAQKWHCVLHKLAPFPLGGLCNIIIYTPSQLVVVQLLCSCPKCLGSGSYFAPPSSPQRRWLLFMLHFFVCAEIIFALYLSISTYVIEVQHINENFPTIRKARRCLQAGCTPLRNQTYENQNISRR